MATLQPPIPQGFSALLQLAAGMEPEIASALAPLLYAISIQFQALASSIGQMATTAATSVNRPTAAQLETLPSAGVGFSMLDQTLNIPIWVLSNDGTTTAWISANGTLV